MTVNSIANRPVSGYLVMPKNAKPKSLPALVAFHGAGFRSSTMQLGYANKGMITFDVNAHGIANGKSKAFYDQVRKDITKERGGRYNHSKKEDREIPAFFLYLKIQQKQSPRAKLPDYFLFPVASIRQSHFFKL